ncbi:hypothetical protein BGX23_001420 [Mortierella sp. AD031]|nr:hypothetical protein BGX23_001420 [Mortierella sp. AD031]
MLPIIQLDSVVNTTTNNQPQEHIPSGLASAATTTKNSSYTNNKENQKMDAATENSHHTIAKPDDIPLMRILGVMGLCFALIATVLYLCIQWIIRVGKAEHAAKLQNAKKKDD